MQNLIIRQGFVKRAAEEDGPSFEQQFGILANAVIADRFPQLDDMKLAFQLIDKNEDNSEAVGAAVYLVGKSVVFIPAFFKNNKLKTGDIMFIANTQQFLPVSDPWLAWLKNKDVSESGEMVDAALVDAKDGTRGTTIRDISDPIIKTASVYLKGLLRTVPDMQKRASDTSILDTALKLGKNATSSLLDNLIKNTDFLNASLTFYSGDELDAFAKKAAEMGEEHDTVEVILPLDKEAKTLNAQELNALYKDGFFIRKVAAAETKAPDVIRTKQLKGMFKAITEPGGFKLLRQDGSVEDAIVLQDKYIPRDGIHCGCVEPVDSTGDDSLNAARFMRKSKRTGSGGLSIFTEDNVVPLTSGAMCLADCPHPFDKDMLDKIGAPLDPGKIKEIPSDSTVVTPDGTAYHIGDWDIVQNKSKDGWASREHAYSISTSAEQKKLIETSSDIIFPQGSRVILYGAVNADGTPIDDMKAREAWYTSKEKKAKAAHSACVTLSTLDAFITEFCKKNYNKAKIYSNGSEYVVSGDKSDDDQPKGIKEAAYHLVKAYNVDPAIAKVMLKEANNGTSYDNPRVTSFYITKTAEDDGWEQSNIGMHEQRNVPPVPQQRELPTILEDPARLQQAVTTAAQQGIKEVFDVTTLKLLVRQNRFFDEIQEDVPMFMRCLDSLCRKLFQFYWHTDKMEEKYGMVKMKALEESLKCTLDSLSELTIFFKIRSVDGNGAADKMGDLMSGNML